MLPSPPVGISPQRRPIDVLLWGATGFTGALVAAFLARRYGAARTGNGLAWALGGRDRAKLEAVRDGLRAADPRAGELPIVLGDSRDRASLDALVRQARVVVSTVGPYGLYGAELVAACAEAGTDYCDLTGEPPFMRDMIDRHHARARETGARIVHACGFDSIPSDLGTLVAHETMRAAHGVPCAEVKCFAGPVRGGFSGGTIASILYMAELVAGDARVRRLLANPYALDPGRGERGPDGRDQLGVRYDADLGRWTSIFFMAASNARVVRRSNALLGYAWGRDFRYREAMSFSGGPLGAVSAAGVTAGTFAAFGAIGVPLVRRALRAALPGPGQGPSAAERERGFFVMRFVGTGPADRGSPKVLVTVKGKGDPGYAATARMLGESAACLARNPIPSAGGILTPASALGMHLVERLRQVDVAFDGAPLASGS